MSPSASAGGLLSFLGGVVVSEATRAYIYRILLALQPLVVFYGLATDQEAALWVGVISAVVGTGLASMNTSTSAGGAGDE